MFMYGSDEIVNNCSIVNKSYFSLFGLESDMMS